MTTSRPPSPSEKPSEQSEQIATEEELRQKTAAIKEAIDKKDVEALRELATSRDGLLSDDLRRDAWPILLGYDKDAFLLARKEQGEDYWKTLPVHRDEEQVKLDVERAFVYYPKNLSPMATKSLKSQLQTLITIILRTHPSLNYFQGFHDICQVLLLVLTLPDAIPAGQYLSLLLLRDFMLPTLTPALSHLLLIPPLLEESDHELYTVLRDVKPYFALSATLTLYSHEIREYSHTTRLFDSLLAYGPGFSVYLFIKVLEARKPEILELIDELGAGDDVLGAVLGRWKGEGFLDLEGWVLGAKQLWQEHPMERLPAFRSIAGASVLKKREGL
ncbi:hypothetical protein BJ508DRAFT_95958 [Ascobolus immersus RN42]|uniref:Rab-GAP TBC domain-containing protein n=1 Tax=Ascobolus immersus RN42 TaxID=1160509 RepID=A0A3N4IZL5_ASCIM|nr:hypothetical protein BJ508DRAFT_95958 [Ascobolus immersus RN42]